MHRRVPVHPEDRPAQEGSVFCTLSHTSHTPPPSHTHTSPLRQLPCPVCNISVQRVCVSLWLQIARLYLVSDVLYNSSAKVSNASYYRKL